MKITGLKSRESGKHFYYKQYLLDWIMMKRVTFINQNQEWFNININRFDFISLESYVYGEQVSEPFTSEYFCTSCLPKFNLEDYKNNLKQDKNIYYDYFKKLNALEDFICKNDCVECDAPCNSEKINQFHEENADIENELENLGYERMNQCFNMTQNEFNKSIMDKYELENVNIFYEHPCNSCQYKGKLDVIFIFDIGFSANGIYKLAIEIENTSPVKPNKIKFCKDNKIVLIEVNANELIRNNFKDYKYVKCHEYK